MNKLKSIKCVNKPWGCELWFAETKDYLGKVIVINARQEVSLHKHRKKEETLYVQEGICKVEYETVKGNMSSKIVNVGEFFHVLPNRKHRMTAIGQRVVLFEASTAHPKDSVRLEDKYGRPCEKNKP